MDISKLTDQEIAFLTYATERYEDDIMREQELSADFQKTAYELQTVFHKEYYRRGLSFQQFQEE